MRVTPTTIFTTLAVGAGAGLMYLFDPQSGRGRRAELGSKLKKGAGTTGNKVSAVASDFGNRAKGLAIETGNRFRKDELTDEQLAQRVRAEIGHHTTNTGAIEVIAREGRITLMGPAIANEVDGLVKAASKVRGVSAVENRLHMHPEQPVTEEGAQPVQH